MARPYTSQKNGWLMAVSTATAAMILKSSEVPTARRQRFIKTCASLSGEILLSQDKTSLLRSSRLLSPSLARLEQLERCTRCNQEKSLCRLPSSQSGLIRCPPRRLGEVPLPPPLLQSRVTASSSQRASPPALPPE
eukprot:5666436-Heterocapsa_arctica.AAC.1